MAAQPASSPGLGLSHHQRPLGRAPGAKFLSQVIGGGQGLEVMDGTFEKAGMQPLADLLRQELVRNSQQPVAPPGRPLYPLAQGLEAVDALPHRPPA